MYRDAIAAAKPLEKIKLFKKKDPIFLKQHIELMKARVCDRPPQFVSPPLLRPFLSKPLISKLKQNLINEFNLKPFYDDKRLRTANSELADRVKQFLRNS